MKYSFFALRGLSYRVAVAAALSAAATGCGADGAADDLDFSTTEEALSTPIVQVAPRQRPTYRDDNGGIVVTQYKVKDATGRAVTKTQVGAVFMNISRASCERELSFGSCRVIACAYDAASYANSGDIVVNGLRGGPLKLKPDAQGTYFDSAFDLVGARFSAGDTIRSATTGRPKPGVSAFTADVLAPRAIPLKTPVASASGEVVVTRTAGIPLTWTPLANGPERLRFNLVQEKEVGGKAGSISATCDFPEAPGSAVVPAAVTSRFAAGPGIVYAASLSEQAWQVASGQSVALIASVVSLSAEASFR